MRALLAAVLLAAAALANAQEGYPLDGTWRGEHPAAGGSTATVVIIFEWDGKQLKGIINPGPDSLQITDAQLSPEGWKVKLTAKSKAGAAITYDAVLSDLGKYDRHLTGTWTEGGQKYNVRMTREH
jgi:hypothetical protein